jgi:hypothetical protein
MDYPDSGPFPGPFSEHARVPEHALATIFPEFRAFSLQ